MYCFGLIKILSQLPNIQDGGQQFSQENVLFHPPPPAVYSVISAEVLHKGLIDFEYSVFGNRILINPIQTLTNFIDVMTW